MPLIDIVAHQILRPNPNNASTIVSSDSAWPKNGLVEECFREMKHAVMRRFSKDYGRFSDNHIDHPLSAWLKEFKEEKINFNSFSQKAINHFKIELDKLELPLESLLFFAYEVLEHEELLHIFLLQQTHALQVDSTVTINETYYLDTNNVQLAAKVNITDWLSDDLQRSENALTLLRWRGERELTEVFENFIGFADKVDLRADTEQFLQAVSNYTDNLPEEHIHPTKRKIVDFCLEQDRQGKSVAIDDLSRQLQEESHLPEFKRFVDDTHIFSKKELIPDKSQLRQFVRISGRDEKLSLSFSSSCLGDSIEYDSASDTLTIRNIPSSLKSRLKKHLKNIDPSVEK